MKIQVDGEEIFELKPWEIELLKYDIPSKDLVADLKRRLNYIWGHKVEQVYKRLEAEWLPKMQEDESVSTIPASKEAFFALVKAHPEYKDRDAREVQ